MRLIFQPAVAIHDRAGWVWASPCCYQAWSAPRPPWRCWCSGWRPPLSGPRVLYWHQLAAPAPGLLLLPNIARCQKRAGPGVSSWSESPRGGELHPGTRWTSVNTSPSAPSSSSSGRRGTRWPPWCHRGDQGGQWSVLMSPRDHEIRAEYFPVLWSIITDGTEHGARVHVRMGIHHAIWLRARDLKQNPRYPRTCAARAQIPIASDCHFGWLDSGQRNVRPHSLSLLGQISVTAWWSGISPSLMAHCRYLGSGSVSSSSPGPWSQWSRPPDIAARIHPRPYLRPATGSMGWTMRNCAQASLINRQTQTLRNVYSHFGIIYWGIFRLLSMFPYCS